MTLKEWAMGIIASAVVAVGGWLVLETHNNSKTLVQHGEVLERLDEKLDAVLAAVEGQEDRLRQAEITLATHETVIMQWGYPE